MKVMSMSALTLLLCGGPGFAQDYPSKPIRIIVPYAAGGAVDIVGRMIGKALTERTGQSAVVDNRTGAGSNIASELVARSPADGYTLLIASPANVINPSLYAKMTYDVVRDLTAISMIGWVSNVLLAHPSLPLRNVKELVAMARTRPGQLAYGSGGSGTAQHMSGELFKSMAGVDVLHVPYKGGAPALTDLMGGQVPLAFVNVAESISQVQAGKARALAVTGSKRSSVLPEVPTIAETIPGYEVLVWWGVMAPSGTPREIINRLNAEVVRVVGTAEFKDRLRSLGADATGSTSEDFAAFIRAEVPKWAKVVKASGAKVE